MTYFKTIAGVGNVPMSEEEIAQLQAEEAAWIAKKQKYETEQKYKDQRKVEMLALDGDGLDAIRKAIDALANGEALPQEYVDYRDQINAIKAKYPKPADKK
jgi:FMN phosphatase YigB (HAD superfamily)